MDLTAAALGTLYLDQFLVLVYAAHTIQSIGLCLTHRKASLSLALSCTDAKRAPTTKRALLDIRLACCVTRAHTLPHTQLLYGHVRYSGKDMLAVPR